MNQLRQMGLALQNHVSARKVFPTGGSQPNPRIENFVSGTTTNPGVPNGPNKQGLGWAYQILPYLEQNAVKGLINTQQLKETVIPLYFCPSRRSPGVAQTGLVQLVVLTDYASAQPLSYKSPQPNEAKYDITKTYPFQGAISHSQAVSSFWSVQTGPPPECVPGSTFANGDAPCGGVYDGVIVRTPWRILTGATASAAARGVVVPGAPSAVEPRQVSDGLSNTLVISEKVVRSDLSEGNLTPAGIGSHSDDRGWTDGWDPDIVRFTGYPPISDNDAGICFNPTYSRYCTGQGFDTLFFGSAHPGGVNGTFADASVHYITFDVDVLVFNALGTRNGEETIDISQTGG
jgi:hypothetical protein